MDISDGVRENHSKAGHDYQIIKQPKTYEQQVELIKEKGFIVNNDTECISFFKAGKLLLFICLFSSV